MTASASDCVRHFGKHTPKICVLPEAHRQGRRSDERSGLYRSSDTHKSAVIKRKEDWVRCRGCDSWTSVRDIGVVHPTETKGQFAVFHAACYPLWQSSSTRQKR